MNLSGRIDKVLLFLHCIVILNLLCSEHVLAQRKSGKSIATEHLYTVNTVMNQFGINLGYTRAGHLAGEGGVMGILYSGTAGFNAANDVAKKGQFTSKLDVVGHAMILMRMGVGLQYNTDFRSSYLYLTPKMGLGLHYVNVMFEAPIGLNKQAISRNKEREGNGVIYINLNLPFDLKFFDFKYRPRHK